MSKAASMVPFFVIFFTLLGGVHLYLWFRLVRDPGLPGPWRLVGTIALVLLGLGLPLAFVLGRALPFAVSRWATFLPYTWLGVMMLLFFWFVSTDVLRLAGWLVHRATRERPAAIDPSRRRALGRMFAGGAGLVIGGMTAAALVGAARRPEVLRREIRLPRFPAAMNGFRIVQISDLHLGITVGREWLDDLVGRVNALRPDLIAITGDLVDGSVRKLEAEVSPLARLEAPRGVFFVTGNHEYYSGVDAWIGEIERQGIRVLRNERVAIGDGADGFDLAGVDDHDAARIAPDHGPDLKKALAGRDAEREVVLLAHQPKTALAATEHGVGLVLTGHTHGGQIWPFGLLVHLSQPWVKGTHRHESGTFVHVNEGTGVWGPPMRLGTRGEITEILLRRA